MFRYDFSYSEKQGALFYITVNYFMFGLLNKQTI